MYQLVVWLVSFTIVGLFVECFVALRKWNSRLHSYLFFSCVSNLVYNVGFLLELRARDQESYLVALKFGYLGRIWIGLSMFLLTAELCRVYIPLVITVFLTLSHAVMYYLILNIETNKLYYSSMEFVMKGEFPRLLHTGGMFYHFQTALSVGYVIFGTSMVVIAFVREKNVVAKKRLMMMSFAVFSIGLTYILYVFKLVPYSDTFDLTIFGFAFSTFFMLIAIFKYKMLDAKTIAKNYIVDELSEGIIVVDTEGKITYCNKPAIRLFPELGGRSLSGREASNVIERLRFAIHCDEPIKMYDRVYTPKKNSLLMEGVNIGTIFVLADDSEHYHYMEELKAQKQIADEANRAKSQFLANMSHEIRTPINAILGMDEMVIRESKEKEIREYAEDIKVSGGTLLALVNDILDFSKVEEGKMEIIPVQYETGVMINDLINMIKERATNKNLEFEVDFDRNIPRLLKGDEIRIKQCALNLLTNAVKYTDKGKISLKIGFSEIDNMRILLEFSIADTGVGIKPEDMANLFSPFTRIDEKKNRSIEGSGLGISITKRLLDLMGSELRVTSTYGEGSVFSFSVEQEVLNREPIGDYDKKTTSGGSKSSYKELFHAPDAKILVIDDIKMNLTVFTKLLRRTEMQIDTASSGPEGIRLASENDYDIIFIDHLMPDMDGIETLEHLKDIEGDKPPVYIVITANAIAGAREMYLNAGFSDYISKPVKGEQLEMLIKGYLSPEKLLDTPDSV
ncbi:MAG: response regulator [Lachnospiraceae bacterium]|nr:response regulator [Lachnospiraceae bacterium]